MPADHQKLRADLLESWNRKLYEWWRYYNEEYVAAVMQIPLIVLSSGTETLGKWEGALRRLSLSEDHIERDPWLEVMETLRHEMAHQYADEILGASEQPHGPAFRQACERLRCNPRASLRSSKSGREAEDSDERFDKDERILRVLKKTLSLATSPNENEAEVAVKKARTLLLQYNIDVVELDQKRSFDVRRLGPTKGRRASYELWLALLLHEFFFVEVLWVFDYDPLRDKSGTVLQVHGTPANLDMAEYVHDFMGQLLERLWRKYVEDRRLQSNRERQRYYAGIIEGFYRKLQEEARSVHLGNALIWKGDAKLQEFFSYLNPRVRTSKGRGVSASKVYLDGVQEGRRVRLHRPVTAGQGRFGGHLGNE